MLCEFRIKLQSVITKGKKQGSESIILIPHIADSKLEISHKQEQSGVDLDKLQIPMMNLVNMKRQTNVAGSMIQNVVFASRVLGQSMT